MKGVVKPAIYILLFKGYRPKELIDIGYNKKTVYNYSAKMPEVHMAMKNNLRMLRKKKETNAKNP